VLTAPLVVQGYRVRGDADGGWLVVGVLLFCEGSSVLRNRDINTYDLMLRVFVKRVWARVNEVKVESEGV